LFPLARAPRSQLRPRTLRGDREELCIIFYFYMHAWQPVGGLIYGALLASRLQPQCIAVSLIIMQLKKIQTTKLLMLIANATNISKRLQIIKFSNKKLYQAWFAHKKLANCIQ
jgi:hypothetical protein